MGQVVPELRELVEDHVGGIERELGALVVDLLDVALGAGGPDDVLRLAHPVLEPGETFTAHPLGQDGDAAGPHESGDGHPAPAVVARGRPHGPVDRRVEPARHDVGI